MRKLSKKSIKNLPRSLVEFVQIAGVGFYDLVLHIKIKLCRENPIGVYVGICKKVEKKWFFPHAVAGGYCGLAIIKIFSIDVGYEIEDSIIEILNHEVLHHVIGKVADSKARHELDNIHKAFWSVDEKKHVSYTLTFVFKKDGKTQLIG
jgi:hypothetical protein